MMKINWQKLINPAIIALLALVFFVGTSSFNYLTQDESYIKWTSPDETANYFFSKRLAEQGDLAYFDQAGVVGDNLVMPRSLRSDGGWVKPVSFLGIILGYGGLGALLGVGVIPFLTPFFAAIGIIFFYLLVNLIFKNGRVALLSAFILATFPVYIYYTVRSMFHNVLFIVLLIIGIYFLIVSWGKKREFKMWEELKYKFFSFKFEPERLKQLAAALLAGLFIGAAIITRSSELIWLLPVIGIMYLFYARRLGLIKLVLVLVGLVSAFIPVVYWNNVLYGGSFRGGYNEMNRSLEELSSAGGEAIRATLAGGLDRYRDYFETLVHNIFYFGFNPAQSLEMFEHYVWEMFPALVVLGAIGLLILIVQNIKHFQKRYLVYVLVWLVLGVILVFYYGSWRFNDNPDPNRFTIGNSYTRYWLPIYLLLIPLVALALVRLSRALLLIKTSTPARVRKVLAAGLQGVAVLALAFSGLIFVLFGSEEGLAYLYHTNLAEKRNAEQIFSLTAPEGIIITQYYDKFFFPERRVIMGRLPNDEILAAAEKLVDHYPLYYYNFYLNENDVKYLNERKLAPYNLEIKLIKKTNAKFGLYEIKAKASELKAND